jgi:hypothetical protein
MVFSVGPQGLNELASGEAARVDRTAPEAGLAARAGDRPTRRTPLATWFKDEY